MKNNIHFFSIFFLFIYGSYGQTIFENYDALKKDSIKIGLTNTDFLPFIQKGYTIMLPEKKAIKGVLIFLEDSGFDKKNSTAKQIYNQASKEKFAVLSVSTEIPFDFYFNQASLNSTQKIIEKAFLQHNLPNKNIFFLGGSLTGHRAMRFLKHISESNFKFKPNTKGIVICDFTLDWTRKWHQHQRDIRINKINLWEPKFINYMLETHLQGTPVTNPEAYHNFSPYSYFDKKNRNIKIYKDFAIRAYADPKINYRLTNYHRTLYENNVTDIVGFLAEIKLAGNENTSLIIFDENITEDKIKQPNWNKIDKDDLMQWIVKQMNK